jgi:hypothetical protein
MAREPRLSQKELAERLLITSRQVHNLVELKMPRHGDDGKAYFLWPECFRWYVAHREQRAAAKNGNSEEKDGVYKRKLEAETRLQEIELAKEEGQLVTLDYMERQYAGMLDRLRAHLLNLPGKYAPSLANVGSVPEAQARLKAAIGEIMAEMTELGDDPDFDADDHTPDSESSVAA